LEWDLELADNLLASLKAIALSAISERKAVSVTYTLSPATWTAQATWTALLNLVNLVCAEDRTDRQLVHLAFLPS
jgi:hypothetical protein